MSHSGPPQQPDNVPVPQGKWPAPGLPLGPLPPGAAPPPPSLSPTPNALSLLLALRQRWALGLVLGIVAGAAIGVGAWFAMPPSKYNAQARVRLDPTGGGTLGKGTSAAVDFRGDFVAFQKTQITVVKSQLVLNAALQDEKISQLGLVREHPNDMIEWLNKELVVNFADGPEILSISLTGDEPTDLVPLVNAIMKAYLKEFVLREETARTKHIDHLRKLRDQAEQLVTQKRDILEDYVPKVGPDSKGVDQRELNATLYAKAQGRMLEVESELGKVGADIRGQQEARKKAEEGSDLPETIVAQAVAADPLLQGYRDQIAQLNAKIEKDRPIMREDALERRHQGTREQIKDAERAMEARRKELLPQKRQELQRQILADFDKNLADLDYRKLLLTEEKGFLEKVMKGLTDEGRNERKDQFGKSEAQKAYEQEVKARDELNSKIRDAESAPPPVDAAQELDKAIATKVNDPKTRMLAAGGAGAGGLVLAMLGVALWEFFSRRVKSVDEVAFGLNVRLVSTLPAMPSSFRGRKAPANSIAHRRWQMHFTESVDSYRTMLLHEARNKSLQVLMVSSAVAGEGKTSLACHLAISLARAGFETLLVDGDLRNPSAHRVFGMSIGPGLSELLRGEADLGSAVRPTPAGGAWILTAGKSDFRSVQSLSQDGLRPLFQEMREQFDFVVVDSSPVLPVADSLLLGQHVDGVIFSVLCDVSRLPKVTAAQHRLAMLGVPTLGAVVIGSSEDAYSPKYHWPTQP